MLFLHRICEAVELVSGTALSAGLFYRWLRRVASAMPLTNPVSVVQKRVSTDVKSVEDFLFV